MVEYVFVGRERSYERIVNLIRALFRDVLENSEEQDLILCLSKGKTLSRLVNVIREMKNYLNSKNQNFVNLSK